jgi:ArsR family transcriptional regulator, virulence genes transcriptional regulator
MAVTHNIAEPEALIGHVDSAARLLKALANPVRLQILCTLDGGELSVSALNERVPLSQSALSQHLKVLRHDGLVRTRRKSQTVFYRVADGPAIAVIEVLQNHFCRPQVQPQSEARRAKTPRTRRSADQEVTR